MFCLHSYQLWVNRQAGSQLLRTDLPSFRQHLHRLSLNCPPAPASFQRYSDLSSCIVLLALQRLTLSNLRLFSFSVASSKRSCKEEGYANHNNTTPGCDRVSMAGTRPLLGTPLKTILNKPPDKFEVLALCTQQCWQRRNIGKVCWSSLTLRHDEYHPLERLWVSGTGGGKAMGKGQIWQV